MRMLNESTLQSVFEAYIEKDPDWTKRKPVQRQFARLAGDIIRMTLKHGAINKSAATGFIQMFKWGCSEECFARYLRLLGLPGHVEEAIANRYQEIPSMPRSGGKDMKGCGYTAAGRTSVQELNPSNALALRVLLVAVSKATKQQQIEQAVEVFEKRRVPGIGHGIVTPWLHYLQPKLCPIVNGPTRWFPKAAGWRGTYVDAMRLHARARRVLRVGGLDDVDRFVLHVTDYHSVAKLGERLFCKHEDPADERVERLYAGDVPGKTFNDGKKQVVTVNRYERNPQARCACLMRHGTRCAVCDIDLGRVYGELGSGFIHVHHLKQLASSGKQVVDPVKDLRPVCPNCHAMLHRKDPPLRIDRLKKIMKMMK